MEQRNVAKRQPSTVLKWSEAQAHGQNRLYSLWTAALTLYLSAAHTSAAAYSNNSSESGIIKYQSVNTRVCLDSGLAVPKSSQC